MSLLQPQREELEDLVSYISSFPPDELRNILEKLKPETRQKIIDSYYWIGRYLDCFLQKPGNPLLESGLKEEKQKYIEKKATFWLLQSNLLFQAEQFLKDEAVKRNITYHWQTWVDLEKQLIVEHFLCLILGYDEVFWESLPAQIFNKSLKGEIKYHSGEITEKDFNNSQKQLNNAKQKLNNTPEYDEKIKSQSFWTKFCEDVFEKYKKQLPGYIPWLTSLEIELPNKYALNDGAFVDYPGRGQGKKQI